MTDAEFDDLNFMDDGEVNLALEGVTGFCVNCRVTVEMLDPEAVWTSKGRPGVRGTCPECGTSVFRMGSTPAHDHMPKPEAINVVDNKGIRHTRAAKIKIEAATYVVSSAADSAFANQLAHDLNAVGISTWIDDDTEEDNQVNWAGGVHPALDQCKKLVIVLSSFGLKTANIESAWRYFIEKRKPIIIVLAEEVSPPDELRRRPRFDLGADYKRGFRQLVQELSS